MPKNQCSVNFTNLINSMKENLAIISQKIGDIQFGLLRFSNKGEQRTMQVRTTIADNQQLLNCIVIGDDPHTRLLNRNVSLVQKNEDDYLYIIGRISAEVEQ